MVDVDVNEQIGSRPYLPKIFKVISSKPLVIDQVAKTFIISCLVYVRIN